MRWALKATIGDPIKFFFNGQLHFLAKFHGCNAVVFPEHIAKIRRVRKAVFIGDFCNGGVAFEDAFCCLFQFQNGDQLKG